MATIELSDDEALVFIEFLSRFSNDDVLDIHHESEERVLSDIGATLKRQVVELFDPNYRDQLDAARKEVAQAGT